MGIAYAYTFFLWHHVSKLGPYKMYMRFLRMSVFCAIWYYTCIISILISPAVAIFRFEIPRHYRLVGFESDLPELHNERIEIWHGRRQQLTQRVGI